MTNGGDDTGLSHRRLCPGNNEDRRPKGGTSRYRRNLGYATVSLEVLWNRASKAVCHEGTDLELDALTNSKPVKGASDERRDIGECLHAPYETGSNIENRLKFS